MADPALGFKLAQQGIDLSKTSKKLTYRYPLAALDGVNGGTDYLEIKILKYIAPGFNVPTGSLRLPTGTESNANSLKDPLAYIILPIPQNLTDSNSVDWGDNSVNPLTGSVAAAIIDTIKSPNPATGAVGEIQDLISKTIGTFKSGEGQQLTLAAIVDALVNSRGSNASVETILSRSTGQVLNPNLELLFNGVTLRNFDFSFDFAPRSAEEGEEVKQIIRLFKQHMSAKSKANFGSGLFIASPDIFQLTFKSGSSDHPFLFKFKPTALLGMSVDYNASGQYSTYKDGTPVHMSMVLRFKELNPIYAENYDEVRTGVGY